MFSKPVDNELKKKVYSNLQNNPGKNVLSLKKTVEEASKNSKLEELKDFMRIIKKMIKDKLPAQPKFYALLLLRQIMILKKTQITEYFIKKLMDRLFKIAMFSSKASSSHSKETCLDEYYLQHSDENKMYSARFYDLLVECWKEWDQVFSESFRKIKEKAAKLRPLFPAKNTWLTHLENKEETNVNVSSHLQHSMTESIEPHLPSPILARRPEPELAAASPMLPPVNKEELRKIVTESQATRNNAKDMMAGMTEADFQAMFTDFYNPLQENLRKLEAKREAAGRLKGVDDRAHRNFMDEIDYLEDLIAKMDDFGRKAIDFHTLMDFLQVGSGGGANPITRQSVQERTGFDFDEPKKRESEFGGPAVPRRESNPESARASNGFAIGTFGNQQQDFGFQPDVQEADFLSKPTGSFRRKENQGFHSNLSGVETSGRIKEFSAENFGGPDEGAGDFDWNIDSQKNNPKPPGSKTFDSFEPNGDAFFRKAQSVSGKTVDKEAKAAATFTAKSQMKAADFSPSGFNRNSNLDSKDSGFGGKAMKDPFGSAALPKAPGRVPQTFNFGKQASPEQDTSPAGPFEFGRNQASPFEEPEEFGHQGIHSNFQANLEPERVGFGAEDQFGDEGFKAPQFGNSAGRKQPFGDSSFENKFASNTRSENNRSFPGNAAGVPSAFSQPVKASDRQPFEEKKFARKSPFQQNPFGATGNDSPFGAEAGAAQFEQNDQLGNFKDYQDYPEEDAEEEDPRNGLPANYFASQDRPPKRPTDQERFDYEYQEPGKGGRSEFSRDVRREYEIRASFTFNYDPREAVGKQGAVRRSQANLKKALSEDQRFKGSFRAESQGDHQHTASSFKPKSEFFAEFDERLDHQSAPKHSDKAISNVSSGNRMGFTFGGADQRRTRFDDPEILARISEAKDRIPNHQFDYGKDDYEQSNQHASSNPKLRRIHLEDLNESRNEMSIAEVNSRGTPSVPSTAKHRREVVEEIPEAPDHEAQAQIEELKNENEFLKQQCKLLHDQWAEVSQRQEASSTLRASRPQSEMSKRGSRLAQSDVRQKGMYPSSVIDTEPDLSKRSKAKQQKQIELFSKLNEQYALYIEALQKDLGGLIRTRKAQERRPTAPGNQGRRGQSSPVPWRDQSQTQELQETVCRGNPQPEHRPGDHRTDDRGKTDHFVGRLRPRGAPGPRPVSLRAGQDRVWSSGLPSHQPQEQDRREGKGARPERTEPAAPRPEPVAGRQLKRLRHFPGIFHEC